MRPRFNRGLLAGCAWMVLALSAWAGSPPEATVVLHVQGQVLLRAATGGKIQFARKDRVLAEDETVVTGENALAELRPATGLWRLGRRAVFVPGAGGGRLLAGTALAVVPAGATWRVESSRGLLSLGAGTWILQAVDNEGLKLICLDGPAEAVALGEVKTPAPEPARRVKLRPGELAFLLPEGKVFGPVVTIFLQELLATSRLVNSFPGELPEARRIRNLAIAQSERLKGVTNALVAGAEDAKDFQLLVPKAPAGPAEPKK